MDRPRLRLAIVAVVVVGLGLVAPAAALAQEGAVKLALLPVGQARSFFDLVMKPGETRRFAVEIANNGTALIAARTYAADVYTIINGGFGGRLRDEPRTGMTGWVDYPTDVLQLASGHRISRGFTVTVPLDAGPGEYITSLVLENDRPLIDDHAIGVNQIVRQAVAVVVTVPGRRSPALTIGAATHLVVAGTSLVRIAVDNPGNVRLKPVVGFTLVDPTGAQVSEATITMDTFYAHTSTFVEFPLAALLRPGTYAVRLTLDDPAQGVGTSTSGIALVVAAPARSDAGQGLVPGLIPVVQGADGEPFPAGPLALVAAMLLGIASVSLLFVSRRRRQRQPLQAGPLPPRVGGRQP